MPIPITQIDNPFCDAKPINCKPPTVEVDTSAHFVTDKTYKDRNELIDSQRSRKGTIYGCNYEIRLRVG
jgi:hypothetical protein